jgi:hypothetical protein
MDEREESRELLIEMVNHMRQQSQKIMELSQGMMALIASLGVLVPGFEDVYAQYHEDAGRRLEIEGIALPPDLFARLISRLRNIG